MALAVLVTDLAAVLGGVGERRDESGRQGLASGCTRRRAWGATEGMEHSIPDHGVPAGGEGGQRAVRRHVQLENERGQLAGKAR